MKKWHLPFKKFIIHSLALPSDILLELPRITMIGNVHLYIENHKGLEVYSETELKLKTSQGFIQILGHSFVLKLMVSQEILLEGKVHEINYLTE